MFAATFMTPVLSIISTTLFFGSSIALAEACPSQRTPREVLECALGNHPKVREGVITLKQGEALESQAAQIPNPELNATSTYSKQLGDTVTSTGVSLAPVLELGGKRGARIESAQAQQKKLAADFLKNKEDVFIGTLLSLIRFRQVETEDKLAQEALTTFKKIRQLYLSRLNLSPEQKVSLAVLQLAEGDYKLKSASLSTERTSIQSSLSITIDDTFNSTTGTLPEFRNVWPSIDESRPSIPSKGSALAAASADLSFARADLELAKSASWPDLKVGPSFESQTQGPFAYQTYGVVLTLPLPIFTFNGGGRAVAHQSLERAELAYRNTTRQVRSEQAILTERYRSSVSALSGSMSLRDLEKSHQEMELQFQRGLIPISLVIESHRQIFDFTKSQHELETTATEALLRLRALKGTLFEETL